jgi:hypothetical protein
MITQHTEVEMKAKALTAVLAIGVMALVLSACGGEQPVDVKKLMAQQKAFVGSETCKTCHLEHYDSWKMTLHSRMTQDPQKNLDVLIVDLDEKRIREDLAKLGDKLKVPADKIYIPKVEESNTPSAASGSSVSSLRRTGSFISHPYNTSPTPIVG